MDLDSVILKTRVLLDGLVNGEEVRGRGRAVLQPDAGITRGRYVLESVPTGFPPRLLGPILITGYPTASKALPGAENPFRTTSYGYTRNLDFGRLGSLVLNAYCKKEPGSITSTFQLSGHVDVPDLVSMDSLVESWVPMGKGRVHGHFTASWVTGTSDRVFAECASDYVLESGAELQHRQHRFITIHTGIDGRLMTKDQHVSLFKDLPDHEIGEVMKVDFGTQEDIDRIVEAEGERLRANGNPE